MLIQGQVGPISAQSLGAGSNPNVRLGQQGDLIATELHGRYYETNYRRALFNAASTAAATTSAGTTTSFTGLMVYNPLNSPVNLVINKVGYAFIVAFGSAAAYGVMTGFSTSPIATFSTSNTSTKSQYVGGAQGYGVAYASATLTATPVVNTIFGSGLTGAITTVPSVPLLYDLEGSVIVPPGGYVCSYTTSASGASAFFGSFQWEEIPV